MPCYDPPGHEQRGRQRPASPISETQNYQPNSKEPKAFNTAPKTRAQTQNHADGAAPTMRS
jgi:hypothetical protein